MAALRLETDPMPIQLLNFVARTALDIPKLELCAPHDLPVWLSREEIITRARLAVPTLPDDAEILLVEAWDKFPRGAVAVVPRKASRGKRSFAISVESVEVTNPGQFRKTE